MKKTSRTTKAGLLGLFTGMLAALVIVALCISMGKKPDNEESESTEEETVETVTMVDDGAEETESGNPYISTELTKQESLGAIHQMLDVMQELGVNNTYIQLYVGEDEANTYIYNKNGECFLVMADGSYFEIFKNDGYAVAYGSTIMEIQDLDVLALVERVLQTAASDEATKVYRFEQDIPVEERGYEYKYRIIFDNYDSLAKCYDGLGEAYASGFLDELKEACGDDLKLSYYITEYTDGYASVECALDEGGEDYLMWYFDGWYTLGDWQLDKAWYSDSLGEIPQEELEDMAYTVWTTIRDLVNTFAEENGLEVETVGEYDYEAETATVDSETATEVSESEEVESETTTVDSESKEVESETATEVSESATETE